MLEVRWDRLGKVLTATVESHSTSTGQLMVLPTFLLHQLLGHGVSGCEEDSSRDALGEQWARGQLHLVPRSELILASIHCNCLTESMLADIGSYTHQRNTIFNDVSFLTLGLAGCCEMSRHELQQI